MLILSKVVFLLVMLSYVVDFYWWCNKQWLLFTITEMPMLREKSDKSFRNEKYKMFPMYRISFPLFFCLLNHFQVPIFNAYLKMYKMCKIKWQISTHVEHILMKPLLRNQTWFTNNWIVFKENFATEGNKGGGREILPEKRRRRKKKTLTTFKICVYLKKLPLFES